MNMDVTSKAVSILLVAGICIAWQPTAHDGRCSINQAIKPVTKCAAHRYQYNNKTNLCEPVCCSSAPFSSFVDCSQTCRSIEVCFVHRPVPSCGSGVVTVYYFSTRTGTCLKDQGCSFKGNNFPSLEECQRTCRAKTNVHPTAVPGHPGCTQTTPSCTGGKPSFTPQKPQLPPSGPIFPPPSSQPWAGGMPSSNHHQGTQGHATNTGILRPPVQQPWQPNTTISSSHQPSQQPQQQWGVPFPPVRPEQQGQRALDSRCNISAPIKPARHCSGYSYQFDHRTHSCRPLMCGAAPFSTFMECSETCRSREVCFMYRPHASCGSKSVIVYYFDTLKDECVEDHGCSYKGNNFPTLEECQRTCRPKKKDSSQAVPGVPGNTLPSLPQQTPQRPVRPAPPQQGGGWPSSNLPQVTQDQTAPGLMPSLGNRPLNANTSAPGSQQQSGLPGNSFPSNHNNEAATSFPQQITQFPASIPVPPQLGSGRLSSNHQHGNQGQMTTGMMPSSGQKPLNPNTPAVGSQQRPDLPGDSFSSNLNNVVTSSFPQQIPQFPASVPVPPQLGPGRPSSSHQHGNQGQMTTGVMPSPGQRPFNPTASAAGSHQRPGLPGSSFPSNENNGVTSSFAQQIPQLPASIPLPPQLGSGRPSSNHQHGNQRQTTPGMMRSPGYLQSNTTHAEPSLRHPPGLTISGFPSQQNTGGVSPFPHQMPQLPVSRPSTPQQSRGMQPSNHLLGTQGQASSETMLPLAHTPWIPSSVASNSSHQRPHQPENNQFPPENAQSQFPEGGTQFPPQSQQQPSNGPGMSQQSSLHESTHGTMQNLSPNQQGTGAPAGSAQRPEHSSMGHIGSPNPQHNAPRPWGNGALPPNSPQILIQQSGSGSMSSSPQSHWGNPAGTSSIPQRDQNQQWGSGNGPQNSQPHPSAQFPPTNSQQREASTWRNVVHAVGRQPSTAALHANAAGQMLLYPSTELPWSGQAATVGSQGTQPAQSLSWRIGVQPGSQPNTEAQHTDGAGLAVPSRLSQPSLNSELSLQPSSTPTLTAGSAGNAQQQHNNGFSSQFPASFSTPKPNESTQQSIHGRVVSIQEQQTVRHSLHRQSA
uniref:Pancreatic trypsin inhibitor n=1 Tax=Rhipicephalus zambeziensis TaxID=60191 RepID=A0A224Y4U9_9ACAR